MHPNPAFRQPSDDQSLAFARARGFGVLAVNDAEGPRLSHLPFLLSPDGSFVDIHMIRSNPILRLLEAEAVLAVSGPDGYVSPDWYEVPDQVPTWNYVAVHLRGRLRILPQAEMRDVLDRQSAEMESHLAPKHPWAADKMTPEVLERMMRQIVPCRMEVAEVSATWKLSQNKPDPVRLRAADALERAAARPDAAVLAALMRNPPSG